MKPMPLRQRGAALFIAMVALLAMTFSGLALVRAMDTASLIAGNFSYRQAALNVADIALEGTLNFLEGTVIPAGRDNNYPTSCTTGCTYYAWYPNPDTSQPNGCTSSTCDDTNGVSKRIDWTAANLVAAKQTINFAALGSGYSYEYAVERMCTNTRPNGTTVTTVTNSQTEPSLVDTLCYTLSLSAGGDSSSVHSAKQGTLVAASEVAYRATIRIYGPRNTSTVIQAVIMKN